MPEQHLPGRALINPWPVQAFQQAPAAKQCPSVLKTSLLWVIRNPMTAFFWKRGWKHWALHLFPAAVIGLIGWNRMRYFHSQNSEDSSRFSNPTEKGGKISYYSSRGEKWLNSAWSHGSDSLAHGPLQCHLVFHRACYPFALWSQSNSFASLTGHATIQRLIYLIQFRTTSGLRFLLFTNLP